MTYHAVMLLLLAQTCFGWGTNWPASNHTVYVESQGQDLLSNTLYRAWAVDGNSSNTFVSWLATVWTGTTVVVTNLGYPNHLGGVTNVYSITVTQRFEQYGTQWFTNEIGGPLVAGDYTGQVPFTAAFAMEWDGMLSNYMPAYASSFYSMDPNHDFTHWFSMTKSNDFPRVSKPDLFMHAGIGLVNRLSTNWVYTNAASVAVTNYGGTARWTKRRNRPFWWRAYELTITATNTGTTRLTPIHWADNDPMFGAVQRYPCMLTTNDDTPAPFVSEFLEESYLDKTPANPQWIFHAPTNGTFSAIIDQADYREWSNAGTVVDGPDSVVVLLPGTQTAAKAYVWYLPDQVSGYDSIEWSATTNGSGSTIELVWTNNLTVYEGTKSWDNALYPEAMDERHAAMMAMTLVPWNQWVWTNTLFSTNLWTGVDTNITATNITPYCVCNPNFFDPNFNGAWTVWPLANISWWRTCDELAGIVPVPFPTIVPAEWPAVATNAQAPYFAFSAAQTLNLREDVKATWWLCNQESPCANAWEITGGRTCDNETVVHGVDYSSQVRVDGLWTGMPHRVHFYMQCSWMKNTPNWRRVEITDWTNGASVCSTTRWDAAQMLQLSNAVASCGTVNQEGCCGGVHWYTTSVVSTVDYYLCTQRVASVVTNLVDHEVQQEPGGCTFPEPMWTDNYYEVYAAYTQQAVWAWSELTTNTVGEWIPDCSTGIPQVVFGGTTGLLSTCTTSSWQRVGTTNTVYWLAYCGTELYVHQDGFTLFTAVTNGSQSYMVSNTPSLLPLAETDAFNKEWSLGKIGDFSTNAVYAPGAKILVEWWF